MFVPVWMIFLTTGLIMAAVAVVWGIRTRQFDSQDRARYIPLVGLDTDEIQTDGNKAKATHRINYLALYLLVGVGMSAILAGLFMALRHM